MEVGLVKSGSLEILIRFNSLINRCHASQSTVRVPPVNCYPKQETFDNIQLYGYHLINDLQEAIRTGICLTLTGLMDGIPLAMKVKVVLTFYKFEKFKESVGKKINFKLATNGGYMTSSGLNSINLSN